MHQFHCETFYRTAQKRTKVSGFLPVWIRWLLSLLLSKICFLILINHRGTLKWDKMQCIRDCDNTFSDRKTRLSLHLSVKWNKTQCWASDKLETCNKDWQSCKEYASLILPNVKHEIFKWQTQDDFLSFLWVLCANLVAQAAVFKFSRLKSWGKKFCFCLWLSSNRDVQIP